MSVCYSEYIYMLDIAFILENRDLVRKAAADKQSQEIDFERIEELYTRRKVLAEEVGSLNHQRKAAAESRDIERGSALKEQVGATEGQLREVTKELTDLMAKIPNIPLPDVPVGTDENDNVVIRQWGEKPVFDFQPKAHWDLGRQRDFIDNERAAKVSGSRFTFLKGGLVRMQFALVQWILNTLTDGEVLKQIIADNDLRVPPTPFVPVVPPVMITPEMFFGMARIEPREERYFMPEDNLFLIGSAEHTLGAMHAGELFEEDMLPLRYLGYSTAFRREAGSYGKDTKGILRQHQFDKLEFESFTVGEKSKDEQDFLVALQEYIMQQLGLPYQVVIVCTGDMGAPDVRQIDLETWMPGQETYRETHSADLMGEYQARRLGMRVKRNSGEKEFAHTNDATALAMGRTLIAVMENNQLADGSIIVPEVLRGYMNGEQRI